MLQCQTRTLPGPAWTAGKPASNPGYPPQTVASAGMSSRGDEIVGSEPSEEIEHGLLVGLVPNCEVVIAPLDRESLRIRNESREFLPGARDIVLGSDADQGRHRDAADLVWRERLPRPANAGCECLEIALVGVRKGTEHPLHRVAQDIERGSLHRIRNAERQADALD